MSIDELKLLSLEELRQSYRTFLLDSGLSQSTIQVSTSDAFYIWRKCGLVAFWSIIESSEFENDAFSTLARLLPNQKNIHGYLAHLRRFRRFALQVPSSDTPARKTPLEPKVHLPMPSTSEVEKYLTMWKSLENYALQEAALDKLFLSWAPTNTSIEGILLKVSTLNDFYSTNIFSVFPVAKHILALDIDQRLFDGDPTPVDDIKSVGRRNHYSFATKYCSHHNPLDYPIYDSYVDKVLRHFRDTDGFCIFKNEDLKQYVEFKRIVLAFRSHYGLTQYTLKEIDQYLWQLGKEYFLKTY